jgi:RNA polymerase sigma-70 factor (ECF subfamily)
MPLADLLARAAMLSAPPDPTGLPALRARLFARLGASGWAPAGALRGRPPTSSDSDEALLQALLRGDAAAFDALFDRWAPRLNGYARRSLRPDDADDAVQETFLVLFEKAESILAHVPVNIPGYLFSTLRNKVRHTLVARSREAAAGALDDAVPSIDEAALNVLLRREDETRLVELLDRVCTPLEQDVLTLDLEGRNGPEIARSLGITPEHVRVLRHRALIKLRAALAPKEPT